MTWGKGTHGCNNESQSHDIDMFVLTFRQQQEALLQTSKMEIEF